MKQRIFVQLAKRGNYSWQSDKSLRVVSATVDRPTKRAPDSIVVKLILDIPEAAFEPLTVAAVTVPLSDIERPNVMVEDANS